MGVSARTMVLAGVIVGGCTNILGIDGDYTQVDLGAPTGGGNADADASAGGSAAGPTYAPGGAAGSSGYFASGGATGVDTSGPTPVDGVPGTGGLQNSGGSTNLAGATNTGGGVPGCEVEGGVCADGQKCCGGICVDPHPIIGCAMEGCAPCAEPPAQGISVCVDGECAIECNPGFIEIEGDCVPDGTGVEAGTGGESNAGECNPEECKGCSVIGPFGCCSNNNTCGCTWVSFGYCL